MPTQPSLFARIVAHDLRAPITTAVEALRLSETAGPTKAEQLRGIAQQSLRRAERMVSGLTAFARMEGEAVPASEVDILKVVEEIVEEVECGSPGSAAKIRISPNLGQVRGSETHALHIFRNLIVNAVKHNKGTSGLEIEVGRVDGEPTTFYVSDNGKGISPRDQSKVFEPFRQVDARNDDGLGLGLSLVLSLVGQIDGRIWLESGPNAGCKFWFTWPARENTEIGCSRQVIPSRCSVGSKSVRRGSGRADPEQVDPVRDSGRGSAHVPGRRATANRPAPAIPTAGGDAEAVERRLRGSADAIGDRSRAARERRIDELAMTSVVGVGAWIALEIASIILIMASPNAPWATISA